MVAVVAFCLKHDRVSLAFDLLAGMVFRLLRLYLAVQVHAQQQCPLLSH